MIDVSNPTAASLQAPCKSVVTARFLAKAGARYTKRRRAHDAASWIRGEQLAAPTLKLSSSVFGVCPELVRTALGPRARAQRHYTDSQLDRLVAKP
jgi:hypothetical protein